MDQTAMLVAAVAALWGVTGFLARELRTMYLRALDSKDAEIKELKDEARATLSAKDEELREWRKRAFTAAEHRPPPTTSGSA